MGRGSASESGLYGRSWRELREAYLAINPLCGMCREDGRTALATEVDHKKQHHGDPDMFFDWDNLQGLCSDHHRRYKSRLERSGRDSACDADGHPINAREHW